MENTYSCCKVEGCTVTVDKSTLASHIRHHMDQVTLAIHIRHHMDQVTLKGLIRPHMD